MSVYEGHGVTLHHADCLDVLRTLPDASVDSVVTDPPYNLSFMGKGWDTFPIRKRGQGGTGINSEHAGGVEFKASAEASHAFQQWCEAWATECLRILKPGGHLLAFGGTRTWHRLACAVEDAGFEVRDSIAWLYGSGFPKSLDVSKAIDKRRDWTALPLLQAKVREARKGLGISQSEAARRVGLIGPDESLGGGGFMWFETGMRVPTREQYPRLKAALGLDDECDRAFEEAEREVTGTHVEWTNRVNYALTSRDGLRRDKPATPDAERWQGWGTALKPAFEPVVVARKPLAGAGVNVLGMVESGLRNQGIEGEIRWTTRPASGAASQSPMPTSGSTSQQPTAATSARDASASETPPIVSATASATETSTANGEPQTPTKSKPIAATPTGDSATPSSTPTAPTAPAAAKRSRRSSRSTTSTAAAPSTESQSTERSTPNSAARDSQPDTESFAGIATGLTGSWATVRIDRLADGTFVWPDGLPPTTAGGSTVAANVLQHGTGALNIDGCRIGGDDCDGGHHLNCASSRQGEASANRRYTERGGTNFAPLPGVRGGSPAGRWPANVVLDESQAAVLDEQSGESRDGTAVKRNRSEDGRAPYEASSYMITDRSREDQTYGGQGGASRFFYVAKADASERPRVNGTAHPTVKPLALMRWLVRLVTPPGGTVLEPFAGSGTTVEACIVEGFQCIAIEREADYLPLIRQRIDRRRDPVEALRGQAADLGLFDLLGGELA